MHRLAYVFLQVVIGVIILWGSFDHPTGKEPPLNSCQAEVVLAAKVVKAYDPVQSYATAEEHQARQDLDLQLHCEERRILQSYRELDTCQNQAMNDTNDNCSSKLCADREWLHPHQMHALELLLHLAWGSTSPQTHGQCSPASAGMLCT